MKKRVISCILAIVLSILAVIPAFAYGWQTEGDEWVFIGENGEHLKNKLVNYAGRWSYVNKDGYAVYDTVINFKGNYYYADKEGYIVSDTTIEIGGAFFDVDKNMHVNPMGKDADGNPVELKDVTDIYITTNGWRTLFQMGIIDRDDSATNGWVYIGQDGKYLTGFQEINGFFYYFKPYDGYDAILFGDGSIVDGYYRMRDSSAAVDRWIQTQGRWYYFGSDGKQVFGQQTIDGQEYDFGTDGYVSEEEVAYSDIRVKSIELGEYSKTATVGETVEIPFTITVEAVSIASPGNAEKWVEQETDYDVFRHAFDVSHEYRVNVGVPQTYYEEGKSNLRYAVETKFDIDWDRQVLLVPITDPGAVFGNLQIGAGSFGSIESDDFGIICSYESKDDDSETAAESILEGVLDNFTSDDQFKLSATDAVDYLKKAGDGLKGAMETGINDIADKLTELESQYNSEKKITASSEVDASATELIDSGLVSVTGLGLSASENSKIVLKVAASDEAVPEEFQSGYRIQPLDLSVYQNDKKISSLAIPAVITLPCPTGINAANLELYHVHDGKQETVNYTYNSGDDTITFVADKYSMYLFAEKQLKPETTPQPETPTYSGGSGSSSRNTSTVKAAAQTGSWEQDEIGWWYKKPDGSYPVNAWAELSYSGKTAWYHFDEKGYMQTGWFTDTDGRRYYLNPVSDGTQGAMVTGWKPIDGIWYYFNEVSDGYKGALYVNTTTPDGFAVDADGRWIQ